MKADREGLQGLGSQINLLDCVVNVQAARNSCQRLPSVTVQLYDKYFSSYLESHIFCFLVNGPLTPTEITSSQAYKSFPPMRGNVLLFSVAVSSVL